MQQVKRAGANYRNDRPPHQFSRIGVSFPRNVELEPRKSREGLAGLLFSRLPRGRTMALFRIQPAQAAFAMRGVNAAGIRLMPQPRN
jgi:hypothetical protein